MTEKQRKAKYRIFKISSLIVSGGLPIYAICEHFPLWKESNGVVRSVGAGGIICLIVIAIIFRKSVFEFLKDKMKLKYAPPMAIWLALIIVSYILIYINRFLHDLNTVFWMGLAGSAMGTGLTYIAENWYGEGEEKTNG